MGSKVHIFVCVMIHLHVHLWFSAAQRSTAQVSLMLVYNSFRLNYQEMPQSLPNQLISSWNLKFMVCCPNWMIPLILTIPSLWNPLKPTKGPLYFLSIINKCLYLCQISKLKLLLSQLDDPTYPDYFFISSLWNPPNNRKQDY